MRWLDRNRIQTGGDLEDPEGPLQRTLAAFDDLHAQARALEGEVTPRQLRDTLEHVLDAHGALSSDAAEDLQVQAAVLGVIESFVRDLCVIDEGAWPTDELGEQLRAAFERHRRPSHADAAARVRVIEATDAIGVQVRWLWVMGLSRGHFPERPPVAFLVQPTWRRRLSRDPLTRARHGLAGWLRDALDPETPDVGGAIGSLVLSWPLTRAGRAVPPCAVLADLLDLPTADGGRLEGLAAVSPDRASRRRADGPASVVDVLARAAGEARARTPTDEHPWRALLPESVRDDFEVAVAVQQAREGAWGAHDGVLVDPPATSTTLSVTALE
ncbi:MAG: hypothetical protein AAFP22_24330, partial [Planctomycetota bacterium]